MNEKIDVRNLSYHTDSIENLESALNDPYGKVLVETKCQHCGQQYLREVYSQTPPNILILELCNRCDPYEEHRRLKNAESQTD